MFTPSVMVIEMGEMAHFFVFSADESKKSITILRKYLSAFKKVLI